MLYRIEFAVLSLVIELHMRRAKRLIAKSHRMKEMITKEVDTLSTLHDKERKLIRKLCGGST